MRSNFSQQQPHAQHCLVSYFSCFCDKISVIINLRKERFLSGSQVHHSEKAQRQEHEEVRRQTEIKLLFTPLIFFIPFYLVLQPMWWWHPHLKWVIPPWLNLFWKTHHRHAQGESPRQFQTQLGWDQSKVITFIVSYAFPEGSQFFIAVKSCHLQSGRGSSLVHHLWRYSLR